MLSERLTYDEIAQALSWQPHTVRGAIAGALGGVKGIRADWVEKAHTVSSTDQDKLAAQLANVALAKHRRELEARSTFEQLIAPPIRQ